MLLPCGGPPVWPWKAFPNLSKTLLTRPRAYKNHPRSISDPKEPPKSRPRDAKSRPTPPKDSPNTLLEVPQRHPNGPKISFRSFNTSPRRFCCSPYAFCLSLYMKKWVDEVCQAVRLSNSQVTVYSHHFTQLSISAEKQKRLAFPILFQRKKICLPNVGEGMQLAAAFFFALLDTLMCEQTNFECAVAESLLMKTTTNEHFLLSLS